jgi:hypothetical protein
MKHYIRKFQPKYFWTAVLPMYVSLVIGTQSVFTTDASIRTAVPAFVILFHTVLILSTTPFRSALMMLKILSKNFLYLVVCGVLLGVMDGGDVAFFAFLPCMCVLLVWSSYQLYLHRIREKLAIENKIETIDMSDPAFAKWAKDIVNDDDDTDSDDDDIVTVFDAGSVEQLSDEDIVTARMSTKNSARRSPSGSVAHSASNRPYIVSPLPKKSRNLPNSVCGGFLLKKRPEAPEVIELVSDDEIDIISDLTSSEEEFDDDIFDGLDTQRGFDSDN